MPPRFQEDFMFLCCAIIEEYLALGKKLNVKEMERGIEQVKNQIQDPKKFAILAENTKMMNPEVFKVQMGRIFNAFAIEMVRPLVTAMDGHFKLHPLKKDDINLKKLLLD